MKGFYERCNRTLGLRVYPLRRTFQIRIIRVICGSWILESAGPPLPSDPYYQCYLWLLDLSIGWPSRSLQICIIRVICGFLLSPVARCSISRNSTASYIIGQLFTLLRRSAECHHP